MYFKLLIDDIDITLSEFFYQVVGMTKHPEKHKSKDLDKIIDDYEKYICLKNIYKSMERHDYKDIDWNKAHKDGLLCLHAYYWFKEIKHLRKNAIKQYIKTGGIKESVNKLNKKYGKR